MLIICLGEDKIEAVDQPEGIIHRKDLRVDLMIVRGNRRRIAARKMMQSLPKEAIWTLKSSR